MTFHNRIFVILVFDKISKCMIVTIEKEPSNIFPTITFFKSEGSTDQNSMLSALFAWLWSQNPPRPGVTILDRSDPKEIKNKVEMILEQR